MTGYRAALIAGVVVVALLTGARVVEVMGGHSPSAALTAAFASAATVVLGLVAAGHFRNGT